MNSKKLKYKVIDGVRLSKDRAGNISIEIPSSWEGIDLQKWQYANEKAILKFRTNERKKLGDSSNPVHESD